MGPSTRWRLTTLIRTHSNGNMWPDDTTVPEVVVKVGESHAQAIANRVIEWSRENRVQLNADKCKELRISFAKEQRVFDPVIIEGKEVELSTYLPTYLPLYLSGVNYLDCLTRRAGKKQTYQFSFNFTRRFLILETRHLNLFLLR